MRRSRLFLLLLDLSVRFPIRRGPSFHASASTARDPKAGPEIGLRKENGGLGRKLTMPSLNANKGGLCDGSETHSADRRRARGSQHAHARLRSAECVSLPSQS